MLTFHPIADDNARLKALSAASEYGYTTKGAATHVAYTDLGETALLFPERGLKGEPKWRFCLIFQNHLITKFIEVAKAEQADPDADVDVPGDWCCPNEFELDVSALEVDGDSLSTETTVTL